MISAIEIGGTKIAGGQVGGRSVGQSHPEGHHVVDPSGPPCLMQIARMLGEPASGPALVAWLKEAASENYPYLAGFDSPSQTAMPEVQPVLF